MLFWTALTLLATPVAPTAVDDWEGLGPAWRLANPQVELIFVPRLGRVLRYGFVGRENVLWIGRRPDGTVWDAAGWPNWGGEKVWVWPQDGWPRRAKGWPPPGDSSSQAYTCTARPDGLLVQGPLVDGHGCRAERLIQLSAAGTAVTLTSRLLPHDGADLSGLGVWSIAQVPPVATVWARLAPDAGGDGVHNGPNPALPAPRRDGRVLQFQRLGGVAQKSFVDAESLAVTVGRSFFSLRTVAASGDRTWALGSRAQIYASPEPDGSRPAGVVGYLELEHTSPVARAGEQPWLQVEWRLRDTPRHPTPQQAAEWLAALRRPE
ncbi:MAG: hypothetical protein IT204_10275 [Fimbriimonadaceae bacterium]|nr:hypothetical protein [Fimbriimonadaceae bacterium]